MAGKKFIEPFYDRVVMALVKEEKTEGGLLLPSKTAADTTRAQVVALGPGKYDLDKQVYLEPPMKVGDIVIINPRLGGRIRLERGGEELIVQGVDEALGREISEG